MEERPTYSYIPKNLNSTGGLFGGSVDTRRLLEALGGLAIAYVLYNVISMFIQSENTLYICAFIGLGLFAAGMAGGNGEPLSVFLFNFINYENRRIFVTLRPPMPEFTSKKKKEDDHSIEARILSRIKSIRPSKKEGGDDE